MSNSLYSYMLIIIIAVALIIYILTGITTPESRLNSRVTKTLRVFFFILAPVLITLLILGQYNIYPRGYWFIKGLFWTIAFLMMILFGLGNKSALNKFERIFYGFFFYLPLGFIPFLLIPFVGIALGLVFYVSFIGDKSFIIYSDEKIRIEKPGVRFMGPESALDIYVKDGLFSHMDTSITTGFDTNTDSLKVRRLNESTYSITHYSPDNWQVPKGFEEYKFSLKNTGRIK